MPLWLRLFAPLLALTCIQNPATATPKSPASGFSLAPEDAFWAYVAQEHGDPWLDLAGEVPKIRSSWQEFVKLVGELGHVARLGRLDGEAALLQEGPLVLRVTQLIDKWGQKGITAHQWAQTLFQVFKGYTKTDSPGLPPLELRCAFANPYFEGLNTFLGLSTSLKGLPENGYHYLKKFLAHRTTYPLAFQLAPLFKLQAPFDTDALADAAIQHFGGEVFPVLAEAGYPPRRLEALQNNFQSQLMMWDPQSLIGGLMDVDLHGPMPFQTFQETLQSFSNMHPTLLPPHWIGILQKTFKKRDVWLHLIGEMHKLQRWGMPPQPGTHPHTLLANALGWPGAAPFANTDLGSHPHGLFFQLALQIQSKLPTPAFGSKSFDLSLFQDRHFTALIPFLEKARNLFFVKGGSWKDWDEVLALLPPKAQGPLNAPQLTTITATLEQRFDQDLKGLFGSYAYSPDLAKLNQLEYEWGDIDPILVLLARYNADDGSRELIPILITILDAVLNDRFPLYKFFGVGPLSHNEQVLVQRQMADFLNAHQQKIWTEGHQDLTFVTSADEAQDTVQSHGRVVAQLVNTLLVNHSGYPFEEKSMGPQDLQKHLHTVLECHNLQNPEATALALMAAVLESPWKDRAPQGVLARIVFQALLQAPTPQRRLGLAAVFNALLHNPHILAHSFDHESLVFLKHHTKEILRFCQPPKSGSSHTLLATTLTAHPKILLSYGNLVKSDSCQNYRTGSLIKPLLAVPSDAHTQVMVTWALKEKDFYRPQDYKTITDALAQGISLKFSYVGRALVFQWPQGGPTIQTPLVPLAHFRQIVRLGKNQKGRPALGTERPYRSPHWALDAMNDAQNHVLKVMETRMGLEPKDGPVFIYRSRNPFGTYSDGAGGVRLSDFVIP